MSQDNTQSELHMGDTPIAEFSKCRKYRYTLWRRWGPGKYCAFICLNPSTADETNDDPTVRRCINYAKDWGYDAFVMLNLFAWRATDPKDMKAQPDPIGDSNDWHILKTAKQAGIVVAAWGSHGTHLRRDEEVMSLMLSNHIQLHGLAFTQDGNPRHPLYLKKTLKPQAL